MRRARVRLDTLLVDRGLARSRERARALVLAGRIRVGGTRVTKAGHAVEPDAVIDLDEPDHPYVGRGALKLGPILDRFGVALAGRVALDVGASTGGFTEVLLERGARHVVALDVGHGQLAWRLRTDDRVTVLEGVNARRLDRTQLPPAWSIYDVITIDVSFISLRHILPAVAPLLAPRGAIVALVKPQFEAQRGEIGPGGLVTDPAVHERVLAEVREAARSLGLRTRHQAPAPIPGAEGNQEYFLHLEREEPAP